MLSRIAQGILSGSINNIVVLTGAGISVSAGIPDFRSPGGLYDTLKPDLITATAQQRNEMRSDPTAIVDIDLFSLNQFPYLEVRRPFILGTHLKKWKPTLGHFFIKVLADKGKLRRLYSQNIDGLDGHAEVPNHLLVSVHGSISNAACESCKTPMDYAEFAHDVRTKIRNIYDATDPESPTVSSNIVCKKCKKPQIKPATVLMGTQLPPRTFECLMEDFNSRESNVDLMIIAGTSLTVQPAAGWVVGVPPGKRLLINLDAVGEDLGLDFTKDHFLQGTCDDGFVTLATELGWLDDLNVYREHMCDASAAVLDSALAHRSSSSSSASAQQEEEEGNEDEQSNKRPRNDEGTVAVAVAVAEEATKIAEEDKTTRSSL